MTKLSLTILTIALVLAATAQAQITTGALTGSVTDPSGHVVPGAAVRLTNEFNGAFQHFMYFSGTLLALQFVMQRHDQQFPARLPDGPAA